MQKPDLIDSFVYKDKTIGIEWFDADSEHDLPNLSWHQVYAIANLDGMVPVVLYDEAKANLPGGTTEPGESIEQTIRRELLEEINCQLLSWQPIGYQAVFEPGAEKPIYQLRVAAVVEKNGDFESDPGGEVTGYTLVALDGLNKVIGYGPVGERMVARVKQRQIFN
jgi:8-oxo-dGTP pyrophosphatase MutT (NUDIX family)